MAKTNEELQKIRSEVESLGKRLAELSEEELTQVAGGLADRLDGVMPIIFADLDVEKVRLLKLRDTKSWFSSADEER